MYLSPTIPFPHIYINNSWNKTTQIILLTWLFRLRISFGVISLRDTITPMVALTKFLLRTAINNLLNKTFHLMSSSKDKNNITKTSPTQPTINCMRVSMNYCMRVSMNYLNHLMRSQIARCLSKSGGGERTSIIFQVKTNLLESTE